MTEKEISKYLYEEIGSINRYTVNNKVLQSIEKNHEWLSFLKFNFQSYPSRYTSGLLLTFPKIWKDLSYSDWNSIFLGIEHRKMEFIENDPLREINLDQSYGCLIFISKYLRIDPIEFMLNSECLDHFEIIKCLEMIKAYPFKFIQNETEIREDLVDFYSVSYDYLLAYQNKFPSVLKRTYSDYSELRERASKKLKEKL